LLPLSQQTVEDSQAPATWARFYEAAAAKYQVSPIDRDGALRRLDHPVFDWASINNYHGGVFAWTDRGRPAIVGTIFSFPRQNRERLAVHEFASLADAPVTVEGPGEIRWAPPALTNLRFLPGASPPPANASLLRLHCRRLAKDFAAHMVRRGERWDLRLLPTPFVEYRQPSPEVLGGGLFAFVGYSTDPEILLLLEARDGKDGPIWHFQPVRFSDKSLYLSYKDKPIWESLRAAHGASGPDTDDPHYRVLSSEVIPPEVVEALEAETTETRAR
jgi:hypothetical protein